MDSIPSREDESIGSSPIDPTQCCRCSRYNCGLLCGLKSNMPSSPSGQGRVSSEHVYGSSNLSGGTSSVWLRNSQETGNTIGWLINNSSTISQKLLLFQTLLLKRRQIGKAAGLWNQSSCWFEASRFNKTLRVDNQRNDRVGAGGCWGRCLPVSLKFIAF